MKWIEINIDIGRYDRDAMIEAMLKLVDPLVTEFKALAKEDFRGIICGRIILGL